MFDVLADRSLDDVLRRIASGKAEKFFVFRQETRSLLFEQGVKAAAQKIAEGVRKIIKSKTRDIEMQLGSPEVRIFSARFQSVAEHAPLGVDHQLFEA